MRVLTAMRSRASSGGPFESRPGWARPARRLLSGAVVAAVVASLSGPGRASAAVESYSPVQSFVAEEANYQSWTVPPGIDEITLYVDGGMGGDGDLNGGEGGYGGGVRANFAVTAGETLEIAVGNKGPSGYSAEFEQFFGGKELRSFGGGEDSNGGGSIFTFPGGGPGAAGANSESAPSIGGGGAGGGCSEVILHDGNESSLLVVAPGGGGGGGGTKSGTKGGNGGGGGEAGKAGSNSGGGGTPTANAPGSPGSPNGVSGEEGHGTYCANGGSGGFEEGTHPGAGGGGGGYSGGGTGGADGNGSAGGGGGGSYYIDPAAIEPLKAGGSGTGEVSVGYDTSKVENQKKDIPPAELLTPQPVIHGEPAVGKTLTCDPGPSNGAQYTVTFKWLRDGAPIAGASASTYKVTPEDRGHKLQCQVTYADAAGSAIGTSEPVSVPVSSTEIGRVKTLGSGSVTVPVSCAGPATASCHVSLRLSVREQLRHGHLIAVGTAKKTTTRTVTVAGAQVTVPGGRHKTVTLHLNAAGRKLLRGRHALKVSLTVTQIGVTGSAATVKTMKLTLMAARSQRHGR
jgi:hypothetical protein